jgi:hypothetical protein
MLVSLVAGLSPKVDKSGLKLSQYGNGPNAVAVRGSELRQVVDMLCRG